MDLSGTPSPKSWVQPGIRVSGYNFTRIPLLSLANGRVLPRHGVAGRHLRLEVLLRARVPHLFHPLSRLNKKKKRFAVRMRVYIYISCRPHIYIYVVVTSGRSQWTVGRSVGRMHACRKNIAVTYRFLFAFLSPFIPFIFYLRPSFLFPSY